MKKTISIVIVTMVFFLKILIVSQGYANDISIKIANGDWPPYFSPTLEHNGVVSRIVKEAFGNEGIQVEYVFLPWKRGLIEAKTGKWAGSVGWLKTNEREEDFYFSEPIMNLAPVFFQRKDSRVSWNTFEDLKGKNIGAILGYFYGKDFAEAENKEMIFVDRVASAYQNLKKLMHKRVALAAVERSVGLYILSTQFDKDEAVLVEPQQKLLHSNPTYLLISKKAVNAEDIVILFNK